MFWFFVKVFRLRVYEAVVRSAESFSREGSVSEV